VNAHRELLRKHSIVSLRELEFLSKSDRRTIQRLADEAGRYYDPFDRRKAGGHGWRHIDNPQGELKEFQRLLSRKYLRELPLPPLILGGVRGRSIRDNAWAHKNAAVLITMDLSDCFPSTDDRRIFKIFRSLLGCSDQISGLLTRITTLQHRLPQGAPTSSMLANLALIPLHEELEQIASELDLIPTCYVDDIALSGLRAREAIEPVIAAIRRHGYSFRSRKIKCMPSGRRQALTGTVTNRKVSAGRVRIREIREEIAALASSRVITETALRSIWGRIGYVKSINILQGGYLERYASKVLPQHGADRPPIPTLVTRPCGSFARNHS
jgi:hypothetical protein